VLNKKGQITIIILMSFGLLLSCGIYFFSLNFSDTKVIKTVESYSLELEKESCLEMQLGDLLEAMYLTGGFYDFNGEYINNINYENGFEHLIDDINWDLLDVEEYYGVVYLSNATVTDISIDDLENVISFAMSHRIFECIEEDEMEYDSLEFRSIINNHTVDVFISGDFSFVMFDEKEQQKNGFALSFPSDLKEMFSLAKEISYEQYNSGSMICIDCLSEFSSEYDSSITLLTNYSTSPDGEIVMYKLGDMNFTFVHQFSFIPASEVFIDSIPPLKATVGYEFTYEIPVTGDYDTIIAHTDLFTVIDNNIIFTPSEIDVGDYYIPIEIMDTFGKGHVEMMELSIQHVYPTVFINPVKEHTAYVGELFSYAIPAGSSDKRDIYFTVDDNQFSISDSGELSFVPDESGTFIVDVAVINDYGAFAHESLTIQVIEK
jgi:hypothetical protein